MAVVTHVDRQTIGTQTCLYRPPAPCSNTETNIQTLAMAAWGELATKQVF